MCFLLSKQKVLVSVFPVNFIFHLQHSKNEIYIYTKKNFEDFIDCYLKFDHVEDNLKEQNCQLRNLKNDNKNLN